MSKRAFNHPLWRVIFLVVLPAAAIAADFPHAFPRTGVTKIFENDRITVWDVHWLKNTPQPVHRHLYDMAGVYLRFGPIRVTPPDGPAPPVAPEFPVPRPYFQKAGITHKEEAVGGPEAPERWAIMVDLKQRSATSKATSGAGDKVVLENDRVRMVDHTWSPAKHEASRSFDHDTVEVFLSEGALLVKNAGKGEERLAVKQGSVRVIQRGQGTDQQAAGGPVHAILIEVLD